MGRIYSSSTNAIVILSIQKHAIAENVLEEVMRKKVAKVTDNVAHDPKQKNEITRCPGYPKYKHHSHVP